MSQGIKLHLSRLVLVSRKEWEALPPREPYEKLHPRGIIFHHTAQPRASEYRGAQTVLAIQKFHQQERNFSDIGYHFLIGPDGMVYEGRPSTAVGAHTKGFNSTYLGICFIGDYRKEQDILTLASLNACLTLCYFCYHWFGIHPESYGWHRKFHPPTECPGEQLIEWIPRIQETVLSLL
ncbi:MAG: N-acetylmuramoyl-L-alanine amidase [bacterium JZ-2024 1]